LEEYYGLVAETWFAFLPRVFEYPVLIPCGESSPYGLWDLATDDVNVFFVLVSPFDNRFSSGEPWPPLDSSLLVGGSLRMPGDYLFDQRRNNSECRI